MNNKIKTIILIIIIVFLIAIVINIIKNNYSNDISSFSEKILYNDVSGEYYIEDENGNIIHSSYSQDDLEIYIIDPDYEVWTVDENSIAGEVYE